MRTLLVTIEDNDRAELFVKELAIRQGLMDGEPVLTENEFAELVRDNVGMDAMVARPTRSCGCPVTKGAGRQTVGYAQTVHFKWLVHVKCNKPTRYIVEHWIQNMMNGARDLLGEIIPTHKEVGDNLDRGARLRVNKQHLRDGART